MSLKYKIILCQYERCLYTATDKCNGIDTFTCDKGNPFKYNCGKYFCSKHLSSINCLKGKLCPYHNKKNFCSIL